MAPTFRVVVGIDGSEDSDRALRWAIEEARQRGGTIQAVMAYDWIGTEEARLAGLGPDGERQRTEDVLAETVSRCRTGPLDGAIATQAVRGNAAHVLAEIAADADLLVVGSHGRNHLYHAVLGSVAESCVHRAECPIVVIPSPHRTHVRLPRELASARERTTG